MSTKKLLVIAFLIVIGFGSYEVLSAITTAGQTGLLSVSVTDSSARLSISQENHQAVLIGTGSTRIRVAPGTYLLVATDTGTHTSTVATVSKGQSAHATLNLTKPVRARSVQDINFQGMDSLINIGLSSDQISELEQYFFQFKSSANTVSVDPTSVEHGPHDPNTDIGFTLLFDVTVDSKDYKATVAYSDTNNATLVLNDPQTHAQVFDSAPPAQAGD